MNHDSLSLILSGSNLALLVWLTFVDMRELRRAFIDHLEGHAPKQREVVAHG